MVKGIMTREFNGWNSFRALRWLLLVAIVILLASYGSSECVVNETCANYGNQCRSLWAYNGDRRTTINGRTCQDWISQTPHTHNHDLDSLPENKCSATTGEPGPWCYTMDPDVRWEFCFDACLSNEPREIISTDCVPPHETCANYGNECKYYGAYGGIKSTTANGRTCQRWDSQTPHQHHVKFPNTRIYSIRNDECVPSGYDCANYGKCNYYGAYGGFKSTTVTGKTCQLWASQSPHDHTIGKNFRQNYCESDSSEVAPWCYTTDPDTRWEFCFSQCTCFEFVYQLYTLSDTSKIIATQFASGIEGCGRACMNLNGCESIEFRSANGTCLLINSDPVQDLGSFSDPVDLQRWLYKKEIF